MTERTPAERALELVVMAPVGAGCYLWESAPGVVDMFVARGRAELDRAQEQLQRRVTTARSLGQVVIAFGLPMLRQRVETKLRGHVDGLHRRADDLVTDDLVTGDLVTGDGAESSSPPASDGDVLAPERSEWAPAPAPATPFGTATARADAPRRDDLPIPGYDTLSASQVVERLSGLAPDELDAVHAYEVAHRQRRTILGKIEQLAG